MRLRFSGITAGLLGVGLAITVNAAQQAPAPGPNPAPAPRGAPRTLPQLTVVPRSPTGAPRVACGMAMVPVNPRFDAVMRKPAPQKLKPSGRIIPTPACK